MSYVPVDLRRLIVDRAQGCCEYCYIHEDDHYLTHEVDHIISIKHRGTTIVDNLCLSCFDCNRYKGSDIGSLDLETDTFTPLFNPRTMQWDTHLQLNNGVIVPLTSEGRVTVFLLRLNSSERLVRRQGLIALGRYPCIPE